ncbi:efflux RND transporter periplasmic adaptor subunit [Pseudomaricurvus alcaniphilus]|uniref:efflux RND transporter periplasmic adaptor subunit n=1 Tax=Pseudomaricurvus alcaniphilus TaxID=1166482 RepID=UPI00140E5E43|nr:efflux RND transporter periplasmic adaptor subunit [Pseudomaricurvus alcaniphilus]NHN38035.1 efflux RND transporter periplasmic adaptor subunit [Pseudomaricurvus alcaniphilus]
MQQLLLPIFLAFAILLPTSGHTQTAAVPVFVAQVKSKHFVDEIEALGTLQANENVELSSTVTELVTRVAFDDGQRVKKGAVLVEMDAAEELALKAEELSRLREAERQIKRLEPLISRGSAAVAELDEQRLQRQTSQARLQAIESQIGKRQITAPFDGVLGQRNISVGALAQPGALITTIDDDSVMKLDFAVPEIFLAALKKGGQVTARASAWPGEVFSGAIASISSRIDPATRSLSVRALLPNPDYKLRPGMLMRVRLQNNPRQALVIPEEALINRGHETAVMVIVSADGTTRVQKTAVELGTRRKGEIEITRGLTEGMQIVTHGSLRVSSGAEVIIKAEANADESLAHMLGQAPAREPGQ